MKEKSTSIITLGLIIAIIVLAFNINKPLGTDNTISVSGMSELIIPADQLNIYLEVATRGDSPIIAQQENAVAVSNVLAALEKIVDKKDIVTESYNIYPESSYNEITRRYEETGHRAITRIKVVSNIDNGGEIVNSAFLAGATGVNSIDYSISKELESKVRQEAIAKAVEVAQKKAEDIANAAGVKIVSVNSINEQNYYYTPFNSMARSEYVASDAKMEFTQKDLSASASVSIVYEIK